MSEPIATEIAIGGRVREDQVAGLCQAIADECVSLDWNDALFQPTSAEDLLEGCQERDGVRVLWLCDDQANYGCFDHLETFLKAQGIAYRHKSDAKYEYDALIIEFRPHIGEVCFASNNNGEALIPLEKLTSLAAAIDRATDTAEGQTALELLRRLRNLQQFAHEVLPIVAPPLTPFEIVYQNR